MDRENVKTHNWIDRFDGYFLSGVGLSPSLARTDIFDFCDTPQDYKRIQKYYREYKDPSDQMIDYMSKRLPRGKSALNLTKQEFKALSKGFKPVPLNPPKAACQKIPGNTLVADKSGMFSGFACVRPPSWKTCKWIAYKALKARWHPGSQKGIWLRD
ncbi:hypothetical protein [Labrenzia sp. VG12]|uniref:hypothetical protein n=1 Tax=Labrenzia sp. VG12 TaxID=2021862 RepID=UPI0012FD3FCA|nr:hypothetical protein [Labrenzia sp. VG12]